MKKKHANSKKSESSDRYVIDVIIETPAGSRNKIKYEPQSGRFKLSKILPEGMVFPYDFGFVPETKADDGDPLDVLVLTDEALFPGCLLKCALIGVIEVEQREKGRSNRNDRLVGVAEPALLYSNVKTLADLNPQVLNQIEAFFVNYQRVRGIEFKVIGRGGPEKALEVLRNSERKSKAA